jgi:citrate synthase
MNVTPVPAGARVGGTVARTTLRILVMNNGLEGVVAAETVLSHADGKSGVIWVRGHTVESLAAKQGYEGTVAVMWEGFAGNGLTQGGMREALGAARVAAFVRAGEWLACAGRRPLIEGLRIALAALPDDAGPAEILATLPAAIAVLVRAHAGKPPVAPDPSLATAADLLRMIADAPAEPQRAAALDTYLTTVIDNGLGNSTFAARVVISSRASLAAAVLGGYCAFCGPLHGGAPGLALDMLDEIAASGDVDGWIERKLAAGGRLMGFGHRVFQHRDPRADLLRAAVRRLDPDSARLGFAIDVERRAVAALQRRKPGRRVEANIEMDAALLLDAIGLPREAFTPVFAVARCAAWLAHAMEQKQAGRMIRPASTYIGPNPA